VRSTPLASEQPPSKRIPSNPSSTRYGQKLDVMCSSTITWGWRNWMIEKPTRTSIVILVAVNMMQCMIITAIHAQ
jgi:hypothetical protein